MNILNLIKSLPPDAGHYFFGTHAGEEKTVAVYEKNTPNETAVGGEDNTKIRSVGLSILVHWNNRSDMTKAAAQELYYALSVLQNFEFEDMRICFCAMEHNAPIDVGTDENGIFERVINCRLYYERKD